MSASLPSDYRFLTDMMQLFASNKKETLKNNVKALKLLKTSLDRRLIMTESIKVLSEIHHNLKTGASVVSLSDFRHLVQDLTFNKSQLEILETEIKDLKSWIKHYSEELDIQNKHIKTTKAALEKFGVLIKL